MMNTLQRYFVNFLELFFPKVCLACSQTLPDSESFICLDCQLTLPTTDFHLYQENEMTRKFEGRISIQAATALFYFTKMSRTQHLIHQIKYQDKRDAAIELGKMLGLKMATSPYFKNIDCIIPVPMHPRKEILRGYNQAEILAQGISQITQWTIRTNVLIKKRMTESQTRKSQLERFKNTEDIFDCSSMPLKEENVLIVDDVLTTGATLEACIMALQEKYPKLKISIATIAFAK